jgi:hypothetical protein
VEGERSDRSSSAKIFSGLSADQVQDVNKPVTIESDELYSSLLHPTSAALIPPPSSSSWSAPLSICSCSISAAILSILLRAAWAGSYEGLEKGVGSHARPAQPPLLWMKMRKPAQRRIGQLGVHGKEGEGERKGQRRGGEASEVTLKTYDATADQEQGSQGPRQ